MKMLAGKHSLVVCKPSPRKPPRIMYRVETDRIAVKADSRKLMQLGKLGSRVYDLKVKIRDEEAKVLARRERHERKHPASDLASDWRSDIKMVIDNSLRGAIFCGLGAAGIPLEVVRIFNGTFSGLCCAGIATVAGFVASLRYALPLLARERRMGKRLEIYRDRLEQAKREHTEFLASLKRAELN